jgi:hypothetical protein
MKISDYIRNEIFLDRLQEKGCLVIYDPERRYREVAAELASDKTKFLDIGESIVQKREEAAEALLELGSGQIHGLVLWIPWEKPLEAEDKQKDPFAVYAEVGEVFPDGDNDGYLEICRRAKRDHVAEIERLFKEGVPAFEVVDALEEGGSWPKLKTLLHAGSSKDILIGLLSPSEEQAGALKADEAWSGEARDFIHRCLGHKLKTQARSRQLIADELWRLILFSEFVMDSGAEIPSGLETVPRSGAESKSLIFEVCESLRKHDDHKDCYKVAAQEIEEELQLKTRIEKMTNLGVRDTFSCEERIFLSKMVSLATDGEIEAAQTIWASRQKSVWMSQEDRMAEWTLAARALELLDVASQLGTAKFQNLEEIIRAYASTWRELDRNHREMEQAANQLPRDHDGLDKLVQAARGAYFEAVEQLQSEFVRLVQSEGWPLSSGQILSNRQLFTKKVAPLLDEGCKVAYFLVDSLRYELGVEIQKQISDKLAVELHPVCAQLPTYTEVGMASLMPEAEKSLTLELKDGKLVTHLGGEAATTPETRFAHLRKIKGDQCEDMDLEDLVRKKRIKIDDKTKLLVIRMRDIDSIAHGSPHQVLDVIPALLRLVIRGLARAAEMGFDKAVIATDHGFVLLHDQEAGNLAPKPPGNWTVQKSRCLLGEGEADSHNLVFDAKIVGIPEHAKKYAVPKTLVPYSRGQLYYHEGLSLQECVLPCLTITLESETKKKSEIPQLTLTYRQGKTDKINTMRPVVDLAWPDADLFGEESEREFAIEAIDSEGRAVGFAGSGQSVNPATGCVRIKPGAAVSIGLKMDESFNGSFKVRVLDPSSNINLAELNLKTAYLE